MPAFRITSSRPAWATQQDAVSKKQELGGSPVVEHLAKHVQSPGLNPQCCKNKMGACMCTKFLLATYEFELGNIKKKTTKICKIMKNIIVLYTHSYSVSRREN
jgi:hypothetical protein